MLLRRHLTARALHRRPAPARARPARLHMQELAVMTDNDAGRRIAAGQALDTSCHKPMARGNVHDNS
eukprot:355043-Chlamydomonas_euryale.AAC.2